ncbi:hypothetical protein HY440_01690, partial [Candidatus Microgenomates bacterium]|nr:hypothetical protein [Candidatus Microgenomates bacterium]
MEPLTKFITIPQLIAKAKEAGFDFGTGNPVNLIHHYARQGLIPKATRMKPAGVSGHTVGCYPESVVGRLLEIQASKRGQMPVASVAPTVALPISPVKLVLPKKKSGWAKAAVLAGAVFALSTLGTVAFFGQVPSKESLPVAKLAEDGKVLAAETTASHLEVNSDTVFRGGVNLPSTGNSFTVGTDATTNFLTVVGGVTLDQNLSKASSPTFANLTLTGRELVFTDNTQTLTNKTLSGSSNTFSSIPNSALSNSKVTVTAGTNISGGGDVSLGSSITLSLKGDISLTSATLSGSLGVVGLATVSGMLSTGGNLVPLVTGAQDIGTSSLVWNNIYANNFYGATSGTSGYWQRNSNALAPTNLTDSLLVGATATSSATFQVYGLSALNPVASISGSSAKAAFIVDNTVGDLFTASSSGLNRFVITQSGNVGIGTTNPGAKLDVAGRAIIGGAGTSNLFITGGNETVGSGAQYNLAVGSGALTA